MKTINSRIVYLLQSNKKYSQKDLSISINCPPSTLNTWLKKGRDIPADYIIPICEYFNVTTDYLLLGKDIVQTPDTELNPDEQELLKTYSQLDRRGQHRVHTVIYEELDRIDRETAKKDRSGAG